jgi:RNA-directed DNA polymerase
LAETGLAEGDLVRLIETAPKRYKLFDIPKRSGGIRTIAQPAREVKLLQRILIDKLLSTLPIHDAARAYREGYSIRQNAATHAGSGPILKMDFVDFFPSIRARDWEKYCLKTGILDQSDIDISSSIFFRQARYERILRLSIGAPSSPALSNILLYDFDAIVQAEALEKRISYTRYADDITFSGQRAGMLKDMIRAVERATRQIARPELKLNDAKTKFVTPRYRRIVTGVTLSNDGQLSLGRDRKRLLIAKVHHAVLGRLSPAEMSVLSGELGFANVVEPQFIVRLKKKYGDSAVRTIQKSPRSKRGISR